MKVTLEVLGCYPRNHLTIYYHSQTYESLLFWYLICGTFFTLYLSPNRSFSLISRQIGQEQWPEFLFEHFLKWNDAIIYALSLAHTANILKKREYTGVSILDAQNPWPPLLQPWNRDHTDRNTRLTPGHVFTKPHTNEDIGWELDHYSPIRTNHFQTPFFTPQKSSRYSPKSAHRNFTISRNINSISTISPELKMSFQEPYDAKWVSDVTHLARGAFSAFLPIFTPPQTSPPFFPPTESITNNY